MDIRFEEDKALSQDQIDVLVSSQDLSPKVQRLMDYISLYQAETPSMVPIKTADRIEMLKVEDLVSVDVEGTSLILDTLKGRQIITERLYKFQYASITLILSRFPNTGLSTFNIWKPWRPVFQAICWLF